MLIVSDADFARVARTSWYSAESACLNSGIFKGFKKYDVLENCIVYDYENRAENKIYDMEKTTGNDMYEIFLGGSKSLISIENPNAKTDRELVMFRDSFGSSIAPLLAEDYAKITLVDIRYLPVERIGNYIDFKDQDVLFLYSTSVLNHSETLK